MTTMLERDTIQKSKTRDTRRRGWWVLAIVLCAGLALAAGLAVGRWTAPADEPAAVVAGGAGLTDRQTEMSDLLDDAVAAWRAGDGAGVVAKFTPSGVKQIGTAQYRVDDGSLAEFVEGSNWSSLTVERPVLIDGNLLVFAYDIGGVRYLGTMEFTATGELLIVRQALVS
jgi:hypothetical protein